MVRKLLFTVTSSGDNFALYGTLGTVDFLLMLKYSRKELPPPRAEADVDTPVPAVQY